MGGLTNPPAQIQKRKRKKPAEHITGPASPSAIGVGVRTPAARTGAGFGIGSSRARRCARSCCPGAAAGSSLTAKASPEPLLGLACVPSRPRPGCRPPDPGLHRRSTSPTRRPGLVRAADRRIRASVAAQPCPRAVPASFGPPTARSGPASPLRLAHEPSRSRPRRRLPDPGCAAASPSPARRRLVLTRAPPFARGEGETGGEGSRAGVQLLGRRGSVRRGVAAVEAVGGGENETEMKSQTLIVYIY
ncbi:hypothetical protein PVAP13_3KG376789 [Panicum virgatum]|uniref:Uncharacterized protein n=1 Tax=Panicum virgatum TaxID=38727 RepID=A0A8T0V1T2_PANVG|nr:hypothetical protein PVAP13_3KG376789 [Panicum virgatum]